MAARLLILAGFAAAAAVGSTFIKKEKRYTTEEFCQKLRLGFVTEGFTMAAIQRQWEADRDRVTMLFNKSGRWISVKQLPLYMAPRLYKIILATCTQVGPALIYEQVVENNPDLLITHPSAQQYPLRLWIQNFELKYEIYFRARDPETLAAGKLIKGLLIMKWDNEDITSIVVSERKVLYPDK
jgi:hypothetical protein